MNIVTPSNEFSERSQTVKRPDWSYSGIPMPEEEINWNYLAGFVTASKIYGHAFKRIKRASVVEAKILSS